MRLGCNSAAVVGIDFHVIVGEIAGPYFGLCIAACEVDAHDDFDRCHFARAVGLLVARGAAAVFRDQRLAEPQPDFGDVEIAERGVCLRCIADRGEDATKVRVGGKEGRLDQG